MSLQCDNLSGELQDQWSSSYDFPGQTSYIVEVMPVFEKLRDSVVQCMRLVSLSSVYCCGVSFFERLPFPFGGAMMYCEVVHVW